MYAATVAFMFGASGFYHRITWTSRRARLVMCRIDHAGVYLLIAGSYTPVALLVLDGAWRDALLIAIWSGAAAAIAFKAFWVHSPKWVSAAIAIALGWAGVAMLPQLLDEIGTGGFLLFVAGGVAYTVGGIVYALRRPDPIPAVFGYHELFHALVVVGVVLQYAGIAFFVLPEH